MNIGTLALGLFPEHDAFVVADIFGGVRLPSRPGFVALDLVTGNKDAVTGDVDDLIPNKAYSQYEIAFIDLELGGQ